MSYILSYAKPALPTVSEAPTSMICTTLVNMCFTVIIYITIMHYAHTQGIIRKGPKNLKMVSYLISNRLLFKRTPMHKRKNFLSLIHSDLDHSCNKYYDLIGQEEVSISHKNLNINS